MHSILQASVQVYDQLKTGKNHMTDIERQVRRFLRENFFADDEVDALSVTNSLTESGIVDSTGILELVVFVENQFNISVPDEDVVPDNFDTLQNIVNYLNNLIDATKPNLDGEEVHARDA